ncbi:MAG: S8 family serine peptidase [Planctomycetes bacterium]|nr:S8 family serine peptidase [Planctomycetota bacterium]
MTLRSHGRVAAALCAFSLALFAFPAAAQQDAIPPPRTIAEHPADARLDPLLLEDAEQLAAFGFIREEQRARSNFRVVIEIVRQPGDVTFETSTARDAVRDVEASVRLRQAAFLEVLDTVLLPAERAGLDVLFPLDLQYMFAAEVADLPTLRALGSLQDVKYVWKDRLNKLLTVQGRTVTGSAAQATAGYTGSGVGVAVIDSNFDLLHPELGGSTTLPNSVVKGGYNYSTPGAAIHSQNFNDCYHGTGTASIVRRYAPGSHLYTLVVFPNAYDSVIANAINWCVTNKNGVGGGSPIKVISMSLGGGRYYSAVTSGTLHTACGNAVSNGILCFAASGNDGWTDSMGSPAASTNCIAVGATWDANGAAYSPFPPANCSDTSRVVDERTCYSDTASFLDFYCPSEEVICARCGGGTFALGGTSSACPAAAGLTAQFLQARPAYSTNKAGLISLYQSTGVSVLGDTSKRRVNLTAAIDGSGGGGSPTQLANGTTYNYSVATGAVLNYQVVIPANATNFTVTITGTGDADLYVKRAAINWPAEQGAHNEAEFKSPYIGGSAESVTFPAPAAATWNVLVHGYSAASGTIRAQWTVGGGATWNNVSWVRQTPHNYANNQTYTYTYSYPGATQVGIHFNRISTESGYDFLRIKNAAGTVVWSVSGNVITNGTGSAFGRTDGWAIVPGSSITVELVTDYSVTAYGFLTDLASAYY